jgi:3-oxoadipate enol-lactonase
MTRTLVWSHGFTSSMAKEDAAGLFSWTRPGALPDWEVVRYDAPGHGTSSVTDRDPDRYRWDRLAADMLDRAPASFVAGGASMGCATTIHAALQAPERVEAMLLVIPPTAWETRAAQREQYEIGASIIETAGMAKMRELAAARPVPAIFEGHPELTTYDPHIDESLLPTVLRGMARSDLPSPEQIASIAVPALILAWVSDPVHPVSTATALAHHLPHAELHVANTLDDVHTWPLLVSAFLRSC